MRLIKGPLTPKKQFFVFCVCIFWRAIMGDKDRLVKPIINFPTPYSCELLTRGIVLAWLKELRSIGKSWWRYVKQHLAHYEHITPWLHWQSPWNANNEAPQLLGLKWSPRSCTGTLSVDLKNPQREPSRSRFGRIHDRSVYIGRIILSALQNAAEVRLKKCCTIPVWR